MRAACISAVAWLVLAATAATGSVHSSAGGHVPSPKRSIPMKFGRGNAARRRHAHQDVKVGGGGEVPMNGGLLTEGAYFIELTVGSGTGQTTVDVLVDTGSSNTAIPAVGCSSCGPQNGLPLYNASASTTASPLSCDAPSCVACTPIPVGLASSDKVGSAECPYGGPVCTEGQCGFSVSYGGGGGAISGKINTDRACMGSLCADDVYIDGITAEYPAGNLPTGIIGFAFPANGCNPTCQPTILDSFVDAGTLLPTENLVGMCLTKGQGGVLDIGAYNTSLVNPAEFTWSPVTVPRWYNIEVKAMKVAGTALAVPAFMYNVRNEVIGAFVDSGTSLVLVSPFTMNVLSSLMTTSYSGLEGVTDLFTGSGCATISNVSAYPRMSFTLGGMAGEPDFDVSMGPEQYLMPNGASGSNAYCLGIAGVPGIGVVLGDVIMQNYYIAFDRFNAKVGFAPIAPGQCQ